MKSFTSALLVMATVAAMFSFPMTASAADLGKEPKTKEQLAARTASEIRQDIMDTYGFTEVSIIDSNTFQSANKKVTETVENALALVGRSAIRKAATYALNNEDFDKFYIEVGINNPWGGTQGYGGIPGIMSSSSSGVVSKSNILHELGHTLDFGVLEDAGNKKMANLASKHGVATLTNKAKYAGGVTDSSVEDFARLFENMILIGGSNPFSNGGNSYQYMAVNRTVEKEAYTAIYNLLLDEFGTGATCVKRSAAFLGIELPTK